MRSSVATVASRSTKDGRTGTTIRSAALAATLAAVSAPDQRGGVSRYTTSAPAPATRSAPSRLGAVASTSGAEGSAPFTPPGGRPLRVKVQHRDVAALLYVRANCPHRPALAAGGTATVSRKHDKT